MADTVNITESETGGPVARPRPHQSRQISHRGPAVVAGLMGCLLLALGIPSLTGAVLTLDARAAVWDLYAAPTLPDTALLTAAGGLNALHRWGRDGELEGDISLMLVRAANAATTDAARQERYAAAAAAATSALTVAPGQPAVWLRLAQLRQLQGDVAAAAAALRMSMLSASFEPTLMTARIEMGVHLLPSLDRETIGLLQRQIRLVWTVNPDYVSKLSARPALTALVRDALEGLNDGEMAQFLRYHGSRP